MIIGKQNKYDASFVSDQDKLDYLSELNPDYDKLDFSEEMKGFDP